MDARRLKGKRKTKDDLEKNCGKREEKERNKAGWASWNVAKAAAQNGMGRQRDGLVRLLARRNLRKERNQITL